jgi:hypothetical protein
MSNINEALIKTLNYDNLSSGNVSLSIHLDDIDQECVNRYKLANAQGLKIEGVAHFYLDKKPNIISLSFLGINLPNIEVLVIQDDLLEKPVSYDFWQGLSSFSKLKAFWINQKINKNPYIDLSWYPDLELFWGTTLKNVANLQHSKVKNLEIKSPRFSIGSSNCPILTPDLNKLNAPNTLEKLSLCGIEGVKALKGIENAQNIKHLRLTLLKNLDNTQLLDELPNLDSLAIEGCKKIDYDNFTKNQNIKRLRIDTLESKPNSIPNINFLRQMPNLEEVHLLTIVKDGDMSPLLDLPNLKRCWFQDKKHYSHKYNAIETAKNLDSKDFWNW